MACFSIHRLVRWIKHSMGHYFAYAITDAIPAFRHDASDRLLDFRLSGIDAFSVAELGSGLHRNVGMRYFSYIINYIR